VEVRVTCAQLLKQRHLVTTWVVALVLPHAAMAQPPAPQVSVVPATPRVPVIALVQPPNGGTIPLDRPVLVFRFTAADPSEPLDLGSLRVLMDDQDVTNAFHITPNESWGTLPLPGSVVAPTVGAGLHTVRGRICSLRGACGTVAATVSVTAEQTAASPPNAGASTGVPKGLLGALVKLTRKVIGP
jgi:hypothetical protein